MMKRWLFLIVAAGVITLIVILILSFFSKPSNTKSKPQTISGNLYNLVNTKKNYLCTWSKSQGVIKVSGIVYISGEKFVSDFQTVGQGLAITSHMMGDGKTLYSWSDFTDVPGATMTYEQLKSPKENKGGLIFQKTDYTCSPWTPDPKIFNLPKGIKFNTANPS